MTKFWQVWLMIGVLGGALALPARVRACPSCQAALDQPVDASGEDPMREAKAYAASIYLMAGMPYVLLGTLGILFYRSVKKAQKAQAQASVVGVDPAVHGAPGTLLT